MTTASKDATLATTSIPYLLANKAAGTPITDTDKNNSVSGEFKGWTGVATIGDMNKVIKANAPNAELTIEYDFMGNPITNENRTLDTLSKIVITVVAEDGETKHVWGYVSTEDTLLPETGHLKIKLNGNIYDYGYTDDELIAMKTVTAANGATFRMDFGDANPDGSVGDSWTLFGYSINEGEVTVVLPSGSITTAADPTTWVPAVENGNGTNTYTLQITKDTTAEYVWEPAVVEKEEVEVVLGKMWDGDSYSLSGKITVPTDNRKTVKVGDTVTFEVTVANGYELDDSDGKILDGATYTKGAKDPDDGSAVWTVTYVARGAGHDNTIWLWAVAETPAP